MFSNLLYSEVPNILRSLILPPSCLSLGSYFNLRYASVLKCLSVLFVSEPSQQLALIGLSQQSIPSLFLSRWDVQFSLNNLFMFIECENNLWEDSPEPRTLIRGVLDCKGGLHHHRPSLPKTQQKGLCCSHFSDSTQEATLQFLSLFYFFEM